MTTEIARHVVDWHSGDRCQLCVDQTKPCPMRVSSVLWTFSRFRLFTGFVESSTCEGEEDWEQELLVVGEERELDSTSPKPPINQSGLMTSSADPSRFGTDNEQGRHKPVLRR
jgi:hypothetical protein